MFINYVNPNFVVYIYNSVFQHNQAQELGGGIFVIFLIFIIVKFINKKLYFNFNIFSIDRHLRMVLIHNTFYFNYLNKNNYKVLNKIFLSKGFLYINNTYFYNNTALSGSGGGLYVILYLITYYTSKIF